MSWLRSLAAFAGYRWSWNDPERLRAEEAISRALDPLLPEPFNFPPLDAIGKRELERVNRLYREARRRGDWRPGREIA